MKKSLRWILGGVGVLLGLLLSVTLFGAALPEDHVATRTLTLPQTPEAVWQVITDYGQQPQWFSEIAKAERLPNRNGQPVWRETLSGNMELTMEVIEERPAQRLVRSIANEDLPFGGQWEYVLKPHASGCQITVTERGIVRKPFFRFVSRFVIGHHVTIETYLRALAQKLEAPAHINE